MANHENVWIVNSSQTNSIRTERLIMSIHSARQAYMSLLIASLCVLLVAFGNIDHFGYSDRV